MERHRERVRGTQDLTPEEAGNFGEITDTLLSLFGRYGYRQIETPIIEHSDLFLLKSGEDIITKMYSFPYRGRNLCLRPEFTASVCRFFVNQLQHKPLPIRLSYVGPVFRYERPGKARYRQFTQVGLETIGGKPVLADAETIALALAAVKALGIEEYHIEIGHLGVVREVLTVLGLDERAASFVVSRLPNLSKRGFDRDELDRRVKELYMMDSHGDGGVGQASGQSPEGNRDGELLLQVLDQLDDSKAQQLITSVMAAIDFQPPDDSSLEPFIARIISKVRRQALAPTILQALDLLERFIAIKGPIPASLDQARKVIDDAGTRSDRLSEVEQTLEILGAFDVPQDRIVLNLGLGRGIQYYSGLVFEVYADSLEADNQICGGGRFDDLIALLGGRPNVSASGFAFGVERLHQALVEEGKTRSAKNMASDVLVLPATEEDYSTAVTLAERLRSCGIVVEMDLRQRGVKAGLGYADRAKIPFCLIIGEEERVLNSVKLRDMAERSESMYPADQLEYAVGRALKRYSV